MTSAETRDGGPVGAADTAEAGGTREEQAGGVLARPYRALTFGVVSVVLLIAFEATAVSTAMPVAARELHGLGLYAFAFSGYFTTSLLAMVVSGQWCDRSGPLAPLATGIAGFAAGLVVSGTAETMGVFVVGRAVQGLGGGLVIVALYVVVGRAYPERLRPAVMAAFAASWVVPSIVGPLVSGTVTEQLGWRWVFLAIPVLVVLPLAVMVPALRRAAAGASDDPRPVMDRSRLWLAAALAAGAALLQYAGQDLRPLSVLPAAAGAALLVPAVLRLLPRGTFRADRGLPTVILMRGIAAGSFAAAESFVPLMLVTQRGLSPTLAGLSLAGGGLTWALGSWVQARPRLEPSRERLVQLGMLLSATAIATTPLALVARVPVWIVAVAWCVCGLGMGLAISALSILLLRLSPPAEAGANSAALQVSDALSNVLLIGAAGSAFTALGGGSLTTTSAGASTSHPTAFAAVFLPAAAIALAGVAISARLRPKRL